MHICLLASFDEGFIEYCYYGSFSFIRAVDGVEAFPLRVAKEPNQNPPALWAGEIG
jgi:hypothetical protein